MSSLLLSRSINIVLTTITSSNINDNQSLQLYFFQNEHTRHWQLLHFLLLQNQPTITSDISHLYPASTWGEVFVQKEMHWIVSHSQRFSTPAASRLCLQKVLDFHPEISVFLFLFLVFKYCSREGRLSAANEQSELWRLNIHIILLFSALNKFKS